MEYCSTADALTIKCVSGITLLLLLEMHAPFTSFALWRRSSWVTFEMSEPIHELLRCGGFRGSRFSWRICRGLSGCVNQCGLRVIIGLLRRFLLDRCICFNTSDFFASCCVNPGTRWFRSRSCRWFGDEATASLHKWTKEEENAVCKACASQHPKKTPKAEATPATR